MILWGDSVLHVDHLTPDGIRSVATALVREIVALERAKRAGS